MDVSVQHGWGRLPREIWGKERGATRFVGLDVARCVALLGMMTAHILPKFVDGHVGWQQRLVTGNSAALFAVLAGVSLALLSGGAHPHRGRRRLSSSAGLAIRSALIMVIGLGLDSLHDQIAVILPYYGLLFLFGLPFLGQTAAQLAAWSGGWMICAPFVSQLVRLLDPTPAGGGFSTLSPAGFLDRLAITGEYPAFTWMAYLLAGMAIGRCDLRDPRIANRLVGIGAVMTALAVTISAVVLAIPGVDRQLLSSWAGPRLSTWSALREQMAAGIDGTTPTGSWWWLGVDTPHSGAPLDFALSAGVALLVIGAATAAARVFTRLWQIVFGAGAMTLTLYSGHLVMVLPQTWPDYGPSRWLPEVCVVLVAGAACAILNLRGPLEGLVTWISRRGAALLVRPAAEAKRVEAALVLRD